MPQLFVSVCVLVHTPPQESGVDPAHAAPSLAVPSLLAPSLAVALSPPAASLVVDESVDVDESLDVDESEAVDESPAVWSFAGEESTAPESSVASDPASDPLPVDALLLPPHPATTPRIVMRASHLSQ
jgi:hypothetical protein